MANKTVSFRLPEELITALEDHAKRSGKTKTDLVIEALAETYGIAMPISSSITITSVQQQIETLKEEIALLTKSSSEVQAELQEYTTNFIVALKQALQPLESVSSFSLKKGELPPTLMEGSVVSESVSNPALEVISLQTLRQPSTGITLLNMDSTYDPGQLATQIEYQIQVFDKVFSAIPELIFICDRSGHFTYISPFANRVWGIERNEMLGKLYHEVNLPPEFLEFNLSQFEFALSFGKLSSAELSISSSSRTRYYDYSLSPIQEDRGGVIGVVGTAIDITQRKQAELALQESLKRYHNLFELANDMIFIVDVESHQIIDANLKASRRLRYTRKELCRMAIEDIETSESAAYFQSQIIPQLERTGSAIFNYSLRRKNGDIVPVEISIRLIEFGDRLAYQSFARDVSRRQLYSSPKSVMRNNHR